ncbi:MAG: FHA domain-containing protein [Elainellaceae cyanobacterium]
MLFNSDSSQFEETLLDILRRSPSLSKSLFGDGAKTAQNATQLMEPVLSAHKRCQTAKHFIQAVSLERDVFLITNLSADSHLYATHAASSWLIGRGSTCAITVAEPSVSRRHAIIGHHFQDGFFVMDLGSRNGTRVSKAALVAGNRQQLQDGTLIQFGDLRIEFFAAQHGGEMVTGDLSAEDGKTEATGI